MKRKAEQNEMKYVKFGETDMQVSVACVGTMTWGSMNTEEEAHQQLDKFFELGCNFIDTAEMYPVPVSADWVSRTEHIVGNWLSKKITSGELQRKDVYVATKVASSHKTMGVPDDKLQALKKAVALRSDPSAEAGAEDTPAPMLTAEQITTACDASLRRLQLDYLDLYQLHWPQRYVPCFGKYEYRFDKEAERTEEAPADLAHFEAQVLVVKALLDSGKIRYWGLSNETSYGVMMFCLAADKLGVARPVSVQNDFSLMQRHYEYELAETCRHMRLVGLPYGLLCGGTLSGKYCEGGEKYRASSATKPRHEFNAAFQARYHKPAALAACEKYKALAEKHGLTPTTLAYAWAVSRGCNASVITGTTSVAQVEELCAAVCLELDSEILKAVDAIHAEDRDPISSDFEAKWPAS